MPASSSGDSRSTPDCRAFLPPVPRKNFSRAPRFIHRVTIACSISRRDSDMISFLRRSARISPPIAVPAGGIIRHCAQLSAPLAGKLRLHALRNLMYDVQFTDQLIDRLNDGRTMSVNQHLSTALVTGHMNLHGAFER